MEVKRETARRLLKHLKRAGHDRLGESHVVYPKPGYWDIEIDKPGCAFGLLPPGVSRRSFSTKENERLERASIKECTCGYAEAMCTLRALADE